MESSFEDIAKLAQYTQYSRYMYCAAGSVVVYDYCKYPRHCLFR